MVGEKCSRDSIRSSRHRLQRATLKMSDSLVEQATAVLRFPVGKVWELLLRTHFQDFYTAQYFRARSTSDVPTVSSPPLPDGTSVSKLETKSELHLTTTKDGVIVRDDKFVLRPITMTNATFLSWTTTHTTQPSDRRCLPQSLFFHFLRDEGNPRPAQEKLESLVGSLVNQIRSKPTYLASLAESGVSYMFTNPRYSCPC